MKLMLTPTSGVLSEVTTCPRMTQAWLHGSEKNQQLRTLAYIQVYKQIQSKNNNDCIGLYNIFPMCSPHVCKEDGFFNLTLRLKKYTVGIDE